MGKRHRRNRQAPPPSTPTNQHDSTLAPGPDVWRQAFLAALRLSGNVTLAAQEAQIDRTTAYAARERDEHFAERWAAAIDEAAERLEAEARRRAVDGTDEPVFYKGKVVGHIRKYSDSLLSKLLDAHLPHKYRQRISAELTGKNGGPVETAAQVLIYLPSNGRDDNDPAAAGTTGDMAS